MESPVPLRGVKKEQTRRRLLRAALEIVAEKGFANASLAEIANRAGVTTGAVYSNFRSKEALLLGLVDWQLAEALEADPAGWPTADDSGRAVEQRMVETAVFAARYADTAHSRRLAVLQMELFLLALRDRKVRTALLKSQRSVLANVAGELAKVEDPAPPGPPPSLEQLAEALNACIQGMQQHRLVDQEGMTDQVFEWVVRALLFAASPPRPAARRHMADQRPRRVAIRRAPA